MRHVSSFGLGNGGGINVTLQTINVAVVDDLKDGDGSGNVVFQKNDLFQITFDMNGDATGTMLLFDTEADPALATQTPINAHSQSDIVALLDLVDTTDFDLGDDINNFVKIELMCFSTARSDRNNVSAMAALLLPLAISAITSVSRGVRRFIRLDSALMRPSTSASMTCGSSTDPPAKTLEMASVSVSISPTRSFKRYAIPADPRSKSARA